MGVLEEQKTSSETKRSRGFIVVLVVATMLLLGAIGFAVYRNCQAEDARQVEFESTIRDAKWSPESVSQPSIVDDVWTAQVQFGTCTLEVVADEYRPRKAFIVLGKPGRTVPIGDFTPAILQEQAYKFGLTRCH